MNPSGMIVLPGAGLSLRGRCREMFAGVFGIDTRALAVFRIGLAICLMLNLADHATNLSAHFGDAGLLPRAALGPAPSSTWYSLHSLSGDPEWPLALFALAAVAATGLLVGYRTRLCLAISWLFMLSLQARNPAITDASDALLRLLLFWALFLPLSARGSLDSSRDGAAAPQRVADVRSAALILQAMAVYLVAGYLKASADWITGGGEVEMILRRGEYSRALGTFLGGFPGLCHMATICTGVFEVAGPLLLLSPFATSRVRLVLLPMFVGLHVGFALCLDVGQFPLRSLLSLIPLVPSCVWDLVWPSRIPARHREAPAPEELCTVFVSTLLAIVIAINANAAVDKDPALPAPAAAVADILRLDQNWNMFTRPTNLRVWFTVRAIGPDANQTDLLTDRPWISARPAVRQSATLGYRRYKLLEFIGDQANAAWRVPALQGLVRLGASAGRIQGCPVRVELLCHRQPVVGTGAAPGAIETIELAWLEQSAVATELEAAR